MEESTRRALYIFPRSRLARTAPIRLALALRQAGWSGPLTRCTWMGPRVSQMHKVSCSQEPPLPTKAGPCPLAWSPKVLQDLRTKICAGRSRLCDDRSDGAASRSWVLSPETKGQELRHTDCCVWSGQGPSSSGPANACSWSLREATTGGYGRCVLAGHRLPNDSRVVVRSILGTRHHGYGLQKLAA